MGCRLSTEDKLYKSAKTGDARLLQEILLHLQRRGTRLDGYIEYVDQSGHTPLTVSCSRGHIACAELLLKFGANINHSTNPPECNTALHEAVQKGHVRLADLLLKNGASPFLENAKGLTCIDQAINKSNASMLRLLETKACFSGTLMMKIPKLMGLSSHWRPRWCVIMPRVGINTPNRQQRLQYLLVCYRSPEESSPSCKVWLLGAKAGRVESSKGPDKLQCGLLLHKKHSLVSGAHMTGDDIAGYMMHFRPKSESQQSRQALVQFMQEVNKINGLSTTNTNLEVTVSESNMANKLLLSPKYVETDEMYARQLQQQFDEEHGGGKSTIQPGPQPMSNLSISTVGAEPSAPAFDDMECGSLSSPTGKDKLRHSISYSNKTLDDSELEERLCVICLNNPATAGFLHGDSVHKCCCKDCAEDVKNSLSPTCPLCRQQIEHFIFNFY